MNRGAPKFDIKRHVRASPLEMRMHSREDHCNRPEEKGARARRTKVDRRTPERSIGRSLKLVVKWKWKVRRPRFHATHSPLSHIGSVIEDCGFLKRVLEKADGTEDRCQTVVPKNRVVEILGGIHSGTS